MKTGNATFDDAIALTNKCLPLAQESFAQVYNSLIGLNTVLNYSYLHQLVKDIEAPYKTWEKTINILEEIATVEPVKLTEYKKNLKAIYDFGQDVCRLGGINIQTLETSSNGQTRLNELYTAYREGFLKLVPPMQQAYSDILKVTTIKDQRPIIEKYAPYIEMMVPEDRHMFIQSIEDNLTAGKNPVALELAYLTQMPQNAYRAIYPLNNNPGYDNHNQYEPNESDEENQEEAMLQELMKQLELMKQEQIKITKALEDKDKQLLEEKDKNSDLTDKLAIEKILTKELTDKNTDLMNKLITKDEKIEVLKEKVEDLRNLNQELKDHKESLKESNKILIDDKKIWQETEKLLKIEKKHYCDLSMEQANKISLLEQIHCNIPEHEYFIIKSTGSIAIQTDEI